MLPARPSRRQPWPLAALLLAALACQSAALATPAPSVSATPRPTVTAPAAPRATVTAPAAPTAESAITPEPAVTSAPPATPSRPGHTRAAPFPAGAPAALTGWAVEVLEVQRGETAWKTLQKANQFNRRPAEGEEYLLVRLQVTNTSQTAQVIEASDFKYTGSSLRLSLTAAAVTPKPELKAELQPGASAEGWSVYRITAGETQLMLVYDPLNGPANTPMRFIALEAGASLTPDPALEQIQPTALGADAREPAAIRRVAATEDWEVAVLQELRGQAAWELILAANQYNDPPPAGQEYVAAQWRVRLIRTADAPVWMHNAFFTVQTGAGEVLQPPAAVPPEPALDVTLYPGGAFTGWVVLRVPVGDTQAKLVFKPWLADDETNTRYFELAP